MFSFIVGAFISLVRANLHISDVASVLILGDDVWNNLWVSSASLSGFLRVISLVRSEENPHSCIINLVIFDDFSNVFSNIIFISKLFQNRCNFIKLSVAHIIVPTYTWNSIFRLEHESNWRVVNDNHICHFTPKSSQIFYKSTVEEGAMLPE
jgi:hypothetical protein